MRLNTRSYKLYELQLTSRTFAALMPHFRVTQNYNHNEIQITQMLLIIPDWRENKFHFLVAGRLSVSGYMLSLHTSYTYFYFTKLKTSICAISSNNIINNSRKRFYNANNNKSDGQTGKQEHHLKFIYCQRKRTATIPVS